MHLVSIRHYGPSTYVCVDFLLSCALFLLPASLSLSLANVRLKREAILA